MAGFIERTRKILVDSVWLSMGYASYNRLPEGINFAGAIHPANVKFLYDLTYVDDNGVRHVEQQIFDALFDMISLSRRLLVMDFFLFNSFQGTVREESRDLCAELTERLVAQKKAYPELAVYFITDPVNTIYGGVRNPYLQELTSAGVSVVITDLDQLRDSNPVYSFFWRLLARPFGTSMRGWLPTPFSDEKITLRSYLTLLNLKANHRKSVIADDGEGSWHAMVATGNPHNGSSAHRNVALRFTGPAVRDLLTTEYAVLQMCSVEVPQVTVRCEGEQAEGVHVQVVTEKQIKHQVLGALEGAIPGDEIDMILFYISDKEVIAAIRRAAQRGVKIRTLLDPNKDAFGMRKIGIPNRPVSRVLHAAGVSVRWADTHGEQCHSKLMIVRPQRGESRVIMGSANFTRRNLDDFNLETDVIVTTTSDHPFMAEASRLFERLWTNEPGRNFSSDYSKYAESSRLRYLLYWFMERTGLSTF